MLKDKVALQEYNKTYYGRNKETRKAWITARQKTLRDAIQHLKLYKGCAECGYNKCAQALHFHHKDSNKEGNISKWVSQGRALDTVLLEINKCTLLCANCHAELHAKELPALG